MAYFSYWMAYFAYWMDINISKLMWARFMCESDLVMPKPANETAVGLSGWPAIEKSVSFCEVHLASVPHRAIQ